MPTSSSFAAEARGLTKAVKAIEQVGNIEKARSLYLKAADKFKQASSLNPDKLDKNTQHSLAKHFYEHGRSLGKQPASIGGSSGSLDEPILSKDELIISEKPDIGFSDIGGLDSVKKGNITLC